MPHGEHQMLRCRQLHHLLCLGDGAGNGLLHQHMTARVQRKGRHLIVELCWRDDHYQVWRGLLDHLAVIGESRHMEAAHYAAQARRNRIRHANQPHPLFIEIAQHTDMVAAHRAGADDGDLDVFYRHSAMTSCATRSRSSFVSAGWTGRQMTSAAAASATGNDISKPCSM